VDLDEADELNSNPGTSPTSFTNQHTFTQGETEGKKFN